MVVGAVDAQGLASCPPATQEMYRDFIVLFGYDRRAECVSCTTGSHQALCWTPGQSSSLRRPEACVSQRKNGLSNFKMGWQMGQEAVLALDRHQRNHRRVMDDALHVDAESIDET